MDNIANAFFTQTIVGAPFSVLLGHQLEADQLSVHGIEIPLRGGNTQLSRVWKDWMVLDCASEPSGKPRRRPGRVRRCWRRVWASWLLRPEIDFAAGPVDGPVPSR